jgi:DNA-binding NtrC family response regulator
VNDHERSWFRSKTTDYFELFQTPLPEQCLSNQPATGACDHLGLSPAQTRRGDIPVISMSGESQPHETQAADTSGSVHFLWKPFNTREMLDVLEKALATNTPK